MSDVKRYQIGGRDIHASAAVFLPSEVVSSADYDALAAAHEQAWKSATSESHAWAREHEARMAVVAERDQLRAELEAIRGQQAVAWRAKCNAGVILELCLPDADDDRAALDWQPLYALPPQQPDAVSVPRELLERVAAILGSQGFSAWDELAAEVLLSTKNAEEVDDGRPAN